MDEQLLDLLTKHETLMRELGGVLGNVSAYGKTQRQRTKENRARSTQRKAIRKSITETEKAIVARCFTLRDGA